MPSHCLEVFTKKNIKPPPIIVFLITGISAIALCIPLAHADLPIHLIKLPPGFKIEVFAEGLKNARSMALSPNGTLFVGTRKVGNVYALRDENNDGKADRYFLLAQGLRMPNGVIFHKGDLYVAEVGRVIKFQDIENVLDHPPKPVVVNDTFPEDSWHGWKFIAKGPDGKLYIPVGAPCNVCERGDQRFGSIMRMNFDGSDLEVFAKGIRNSVGFSWHPKTNELWFTDNGRDNLGDNIPPDELNHAPESGLHFGFPYCHGKAIADPEFGSKRPCKDFRPPAQELGPHVASLGMRFYTGKMFPREYHNQIFIAEHGSWNRSTKIGYRVTLVELDGEKAVSYKIFAQGWKQGESVWGRPVDVLIMPDGSMLVSDDYAGAIYRISHKVE